MPTPLSSARWFFAANRQRVGPVSFEELRQLARDGRLRPADMVLREGDRQWVTAGAVQDLFSPLEPSAGAEAPSDDPSPITVKDEGQTSPYVPAREPLRAEPVKETLSGQVHPPGYEILEVLGRGGMGVVYLARQRQLKRLVALKMILGGAHAGNEDRARFKSEAEAVARLRHPNIVQIYEVGECDGLPYFSLEYVEGGSLAKCLAGQPVPPAEAARLVEALAHAMDHAHRQGIVHRDLKPANVLLQKPEAAREDGGNRSTHDDAGRSPTLDASPVTSELCPKITDFGLAKQLGEEAGQTRTGAVMGTPSYMAPEQAAGKVHEIGPPADVYALGAILYETLTGRPPFRGASLIETLDQVRNHEPVAPSRLQPRVPRDLETICLKCLQKEPGKRYGSALDLAEDLARFRAGVPVKARPVGLWERGLKLARRRPLVTGLVTLSAAALAALLGVILWSNVRLRETTAQAESDRDAARTSANQARENEILAQLRELDARGHSYASGVSLGYQAWNLGDVERVLDRLEEQRPLPGQKDLRGFEWYCLWRLSHSDRRTLRGHGGAINNIAYSPDGRLLASAGADRTVRLWDAKTGKPGHVLRGHEDEVWGLAFSADGTLLASGCCHLYSGARDQTIRLWDVATGQERGILKEHTKGVRSVAFAPDGKTLASASYDNKIRLWDVAARKELAVLATEKNWPVAVVFSLGGRMLISASYDHTIKMWNIERRAEVATLLGHEHIIQSLALSPDDKLLASGSSDGTTRLWDLGQRKEVANFRSGEAMGVAFSPDGKLLATAGQNVKLWDIEKRSRVQSLSGHSGWVHAVAFSPDGTTLASAGTDHMVKLWDLPPRPEAVAGHASGVFRVALSPDGATLATGGHDATVHVWDVASGRHRYALRKHTATITGLVFSPDGRVLVTGSNDMRMIFFEVATGKPLGAFARTEPIQDLAFSADGKILAIPSGNECCLLRMPKDIKEDEGLHLSKFTSTLKLGSQPCYCAAFAPDSRRIAVGTGTGTVLIWDIVANKSLGEGKVSGAVWRIQFSPDGKTVASVGSDRMVRLWDAGTAKEIRVLRGHTGQVVTAVFAPDSELLATASFNTTEPSIRLWEVKTGKEVRSFNGRNGGTLSLAFTPDGRALASGGRQTAHLWDVATGRERTRFRAQSAIWSMALDPSEQTLAVGGNGSVRLLDAATLRERRVLNGHTWEVRSLTFSPDGQTLAAAESHWPDNHRGAVKLWDPATGRLKSTLAEADYGIHAVAFAPDGKLLATGGGTMSSGEVQLWEPATGRRVATLPGHTRMVRSVSFSPDGTLLASASADFYPMVYCEVRLWDVAAGKERANFEVPCGVHAVAFSPDGRLLAAACNNDALLLWDVETGRRVTSLLGHTNGIRAVGFAASSTRLISGSQDHTVRMWDLTTRQEIGVLKAHSIPITCVAFSGKQGCLYSASGQDNGEGELRAWRAAPTAESETPPNGASAKRR